jgi:hypothetical protein
MSKHTATPWHLYKSQYDGRLYVLTEPRTNDPFKGRTICHSDGSKEGEQNMRFIVKAVNNHERLVAALKQCEDIIGMARLQGKLSDNAQSPVNDALIAARAAIAKAQL